MYNYNFIKTDRENYISNLIRNKILPNLNKYEFDILMERLVLLIEYISIRFAIEPFKYDLFWHQLTQNDNRDIIALFNLLLPYIDDVEGSFSLHHKIYSLSDISTKKSDSNLDSSKNNYLISNIQYNLYNDKEVSYNIDCVNRNFHLLLGTIDRISNKLYVNWLNIVPLTLQNYKSSYLYKNRLVLKDIRDDINVEITYKKLNRAALTYNLRFKQTCFMNQDSIWDDKLDDFEPFYVEKVEKQEKLDVDILFKNKGIALGDIFNTLYYDLYYDIVKIKWLIYQDTFDDDNHVEIYIKKFNELIAIPGMYQNMLWNELNISEQHEFIAKWNNLYDKIIMNHYKPRNSYAILLKSIIMFMERNYGVAFFNKFKENGYERLTSVYSDEFDEIDDDMEGIPDIDDIPYDELIDRVKKLPIEHIYLYLKGTIQKFIPTWYGRNIVLFHDPSNPDHYNYNKQGILMSGLDNVKFNYESYIVAKINKNIIKLKTKNGLDILLPEDISIGYKFFYNYAKAFFLIYQNEDKTIRTNWYSMSPRERDTMFGFLNCSYITALEMREEYNFNVMSFSKYFKRTYENANIKYNGINIFNETKTDGEYITGISNYLGCIIFDYIRENIMDIAFETHIMKGLLTEFKIIPQLTDNNYLGTSYDDKIRNRYNNLKKYVFTCDNLNDYKNNAFYYLTNAPYGDLNEIHISSKKNYFELLTSDYRWFTFYSMDWVAQINFFHRYINNRVIYVTGATGQGKSTQVPKLFLYGLKMIDRKMNGKIICSQPRVAPTRDNSGQISFELGVPIAEVSQNNKQKIKTFYPYVQYKTQDDSHIIEQHYGLKLQLVTDRLLYMNFLASPLFKEVEKTDEDDSAGDAVEYNIYKKDNICDIIMVDESHEHNTNMDLILTLARDTVKYNNSLKLVIISATMSDDEPIYRRYYREIDDNLSYPYNFYNAHFNFDRFDVDRRIHISPPGETTQHKVTDVYLTYEPETYKEAEELGIKKIMEIVTDPNSKGDILFFSLSSEDIRKVCKLINSTLPATSDFICLPFYREVPPKWQIFNDLAKKVRQITVDREDLFDDMYPSINKTPRKKPTGTYKRTIIVATNIAEASITVNSLKYVIDTGYFISVSDDPYADEPKIDRKKISEASRIQRRGRVGRVSSGKVFYMYKRDSRKNIKSDFKICIENIALELYDISPSKYNDKQLISNYDWFTILYENITDEKIVKNIKKNFPYLYDSKILQNLIQTQYTYYNCLLPSILNLLSRSKMSYQEIYNKFIYYISKQHIDKSNEIFRLIFSFDTKKTFDLIQTRPLRFISGYDIKSSIYDPDGIFYIIHPEEKNIKRNILTGEILTVHKHNMPNLIESEHIVSYKIKIYLDKCFSYNLFINHNTQYTKSEIFRTNNYDAFSKIDFDYEKSTIGRIIQQIIIKFKMNDSPVINRALLNTLIYAHISNVHHIVIIMIVLLNFSEYKLSGLNKNYQMYKTFYGSDDLYVYYRLSLVIYEKIQKLKTKSKDVKMLDFIKEKEEFILQKKKIMTDLKNKINYWNLDMDPRKYDKFNSLANQNKLDSERNMIDYLLETSKFEDKILANSFLDIFRSSSIEIDANAIMKTMRFYMDIKNQFDEQLTNNLLWFKYHMPIRSSTDEWTNIKKAFIYGFGLFQTVMYNHNIDSFIDIDQPDKIMKSSNDTITSYSKIMVYLSRNSIKNEISILIDTDLDTIVECNLYNYNPLYLNAFFFNDIPPESDITNDLISMYYNIHNNKYKYISHLKTTYYNQKSNNIPIFKKLFSKPNNFVEYLLKLWSTDVKQNIYYVNRIDNADYNSLRLHAQNGGNKIFKLNIKNIPKILNALNITPIQFYHILDGLSNDFRIHSYKNYLCFQLIS